MQKVLLLICIGWIGTAAAQEKKQLPKFQYRTITQIGLLAGSTTEGTTLQLIGGVKNRRLFTGMGTGLDFYMYRGIPLFADIRYDILKKKEHCLCMPMVAFIFPGRMKEQMGAV
jgi:hypothetical protein